MCESEFVLAIDAGTHRFTAVTACAAPSGRIEVASFAVGGGRDSTAVHAVVTADGDLLFGDEAEQTAARHPERALRDVVGRIGDDVPLVVGGYAMPAEDVLARLVLWVTAAASAVHGARPASIALTHPAGWRGHRLGLVEQALRAVDLEVLLVANPVAAAAERTDAEAPRGLRAVFDLGSDTCTAAIVRTTGSGVRQVGPAVVIDEVGGTGFDDQLLAHALLMTGGPLAEASALEERARLIQARSSAVTAKHALSFDGDAEIEVGTAESSALVRITRSEFEGMIGDDLDRAVDALDQALEQTDLTADDLVEVLLVGGSSSIPLLVQRLSARFDVAIVAASEPQLSIASGAARGAWMAFAAAASAAAVPPDTADASDGGDTDDEEPPRQGILSTFRSRAGRIATPAASAAALTVTAVLVGGGIILGTTAPAGDRSDAAAAEELMSAELAADSFSGARHDSDFSVTGGSEENAPLSDALTDGITDALGLGDTGVAVSEPRSRTPQSPGDPSSPPSANAPRTNGGSGSSPSGGSGGSAPAPSNPGSSNPAPSDPAPSDPGPADPQPSDPSPTDPSPSDPPPTDPGPTEPVPSDPPPTDPDPQDPAPTDPSSPPVDPQPPEPDPSPSTAEDPTPPSTDPSPPPPTP